MADGDGGDAPLSWTVQTKDTIMKVIGIAIAAVLTLVSVIPNSSEKESGNGDEKIFEVGKLIYGLPADFYLLAFSTNLLIVCASAIIFLTWALPGRPIIIYAASTILIIYGLLMIRIMPQFFVRVGGHTFSSFVLVWPSALAIIISAVTAYQLGTYIYWFLRVLTKVTATAWNGMCDFLHRKLWPAVLKSVGMV